MLTHHQLRDHLSVCHGCHSRATPFGIKALDSGEFTRISPYTVKLAVDPTLMTLLSVITTIDQDRAGDIVIPTGLQNPASITTGKAIRIRSIFRSRSPPRSAKCGPRAVRRTLLLPMYSICTRMVRRPGSSWVEVMGLNRRP